MNIENKVCTDCKVKLSDIGCYYLDAENCLCAHCADKKGLIEENIILTINNNNEQELDDEHH